jgi:phage terminase large subunit
MIHTTAIDKIRNIKARKKIIQGGSSSGKTYSILTILIDYAIRNQNKSITVVSESMPHIRRGALRDFLNIMKSTGRFIEGHYNRTNLIYTFGSGSYIEFFSVDSPDKLKGARRDVLYVNECNSITYEAFDQLLIRTRGDVYLDYNPDRLFWAITDTAKEPDAELIILKYTDNEALDQSIIDQFMIKIDKAKTSDYWANWCKVYIDGEVGSLEGVVFDNWRLIDRIPLDASLIGIGLDFGFTNDPTSAVAVWKIDNEYILDELIYQTGLFNSNIASLLKQNDIDRSVEIWADSSDPRSIKELKNFGFRINGVKKGPDSIMYGIGLMQDLNLRVTSRSTNLINELQNYQWLKDRDGHKTNQPQDSLNHAIDSARYLIMSKLGKRNSNSTPFKISN